VENLNKKNSYNHWLYDAFFFKNMKKALGGKVRLIITGSAPISPKVLESLKAMFSCPIIEGYG